SPQPRASQTSHPSLPANRKLKCRFCCLSASLAGLDSTPPLWKIAVMKKVLSKAEMVRRIEKASEAENLFPGVLGMLGNPVKFAARWGLPLSKGYLNFKEKPRTANRRRSSPDRQNGAARTCHTSRK